MAIPDPEMARPEAIPDELNSNSLLRDASCCFCFPRRSFWHRVSSSSSSTHGSADVHHHWWERGIHALKKLREFSELVAGPKWKTFIRRFSRNRHRSGDGRSGKFQYDPLSYALNFDEGQSGDLEDGDDYVALRSFSSRYASVPAGGKS